MPKSDKAEKLEQKRESYAGRLKWLGKALTAMKDEQKKLERKRAKYEGKLKKIDDRLQGI
jgi:chromosome segregation ATPase